MDYTHEHTFTLSPAIKQPRDSEGRKLKIILTHGWSEMALGGRNGGRKVETLYFRTAKEAEAHAKTKGWTRR